MNKVIALFKPAIVRAIALYNTAMVEAMPAAGFAYALYKDGMVEAIAKRCCKQIAAI